MDIQIEAAPKINSIGPHCIRII